MLGVSHYKAGECLPLLLQQHMLLVVWLYKTSSIKGIVKLAVRKLHWIKLPYNGYATNVYNSLTSIVRLKPYHPLLEHE